MEIRNYFRVIRRFIWWLIIPLIVVLILTLILSLVYKESYQSTVTLAINRKSQQKETLDYQFDSYYAIQANDMLAKQFTEWLKGGSVIPSIYLRAGLKEENALLIKEWKITNHSPQDIEIVLRGRDKERVSNLAKAAAATVDATTTHGAMWKIQEAVSATTIPFANVFRRSRYGCRMPAPRRPCSRALSQRT